MGRHSDSDSGGSRREHKKRSHRRSRSPSAGRSSGESSASHHRKKSKSKKESRSRSPSKSKSMDKGHKHQQARSSSRERKSSSRSQSSTRYRKSRSRSPAHSSRSRHKSRSRSREKSKYDKTSSKSAESSSKDKKYDKTSSRSGGENSAKLSPIPEVALTQEQQLKMKMQMAFKAAAEADAQLRQKGILLSGKSEVHTKLSQPKTEATIPLPALSVHEQISKAQAITVINAPGFEPSNFVSGRLVVQETALSKSIMDNHEAVIFGTNAESRAIESRLSQKATAAFESIIKDDLIHPNLFADVAAKQERWIRRLYTMRLKKLNGEAMS